MGYSARYHAASLIAVFLALAIGILIGAEFGGDALDGTREDLEQSLVGNLQDARSRTDELNGELGRANEFAERVYPVLTRDRLLGSRYGIVAMGGLPNSLTEAVEEALAPTGGRLVAVGVVREPVDVNGLAGKLSETRFADLRANPEQLTALGAGLGRQLVLGGNLPEFVRGELFSRASGTFGKLDGVIVVSQPPEKMGPKQRVRATELETALMSGMSATRAPVVGIEESGSEESSVGLFQGNGLSSVDDIESPAGQLALVFAMLGAEGSFGVKGTADRLLPDLLTPEG